MNDSDTRNDLITRWRRQVARAMLNYPTDPLSLGLGLLGLIALLLMLLLGMSWAGLLFGVGLLGLGVLGLVIARGRYVLYAFRVIIGGATLALVAFLLVLAPYPIWWMVAFPLGAALSAMVIYYFGARWGALWGLLQIVAAFLGFVLAASDPAVDVLALAQALLAGELLIVLGHGGLVLLMPVQADAEARSLAIAQQNRELGDLISQFSATADGLVRASSAIHMVTTQQGGGAEQQAAAITEVVTMLSEFMALAEEVGEQARGVADLSARTAAVSESGGQTIQQAVEGMAKIRAQVTAIASNIAALVDQMQRIDEIITSVSEIATQSNLLALNASIEAARAGVHGRGFAVVADEVRTLARRSKDAAVQVQMILGEIQEAMRQTVGATQVGDQQVDEGMALSHQAGLVIAQLADSVNESTEAVRNISSAIEQQTTGLQQISTAMQDINAITQQNLAATRTAESVVDTLNRLSEELLVTMARYEQGDGRTV